MNGSNGIQWGVHMGGSMATAMMSSWNGLDTLIAAATAMAKANLHMY